MTDLPVTVDDSIPTTPHVRTYRGRHVIAKRDPVLVFWNGTFPDTWTTTPARYFRSRAELMAEWAKVHGSELPTTKGTP